MIDTKNHDPLDKLFPLLNFDEMRPIIPLVVEGDEASNCEIWNPSMRKGRKKNQSRFGREKIVTGSQ